MDEEKLRQIIAQNLIYYRKMANYTQAEVAELLAYSDKSISKWERGDGLPDVIVLTKLARLYHINTSDFLSENQRKHIAMQYWNKYLLAGCAGGLAWLVAAVVFFVLNLFTEIPNLWLIFIYAIPVSAVTTLALFAVWHYRVSCFISTSFLIWGIATSLYLSFLVEATVWIFLIAGVMQIIAIMWFFFRHLLKKQIKTET